MFHIFSDYDIKLSHLHHGSANCCLLVPSIGPVTPLFPCVGDDLLVRKFCYKLMLEESIYDALL